MRLFRNTNSPASLDIKIRFVVMQQFHLATSSPQLLSLADK